MNRTIPPGITNTSELALELKECKKMLLDNGVEVYFFPGEGQEVLSIDWVYDAGNCFEEKKLVAAATSFMLKCGTRNMNAYEINETFEYYGASLKRDNRSETASVSLHLLARHLPNLLPKVHEIIYDSVFPQSELDIYKQNVTQQLRISLKKCDFVANRQIDVALYGADHPYGKCSSEEAYQALTREDLLAHYEQYYRNGSFRIFAAGNIPDDLEAQLNKYFGQHKVTRNPVPEQVYTRVFDPQKKHRIANDPNGVQGAIRMARSFTNRHDPDFPGVMVLNNIWGGYFGSRLMSNIREEKGYTYGIYSYLQNNVKHTSWMVSTEAGRAVCEAAIEEIYKEMDLLRNELVDEEELLLVRNYMAGQMLSDLDGPFQMIGRWKTYVLHGVGQEYFRNYIHVMRTITPEQLRELARKYLVKEDFYEMLVI